MPTVRLHMTSALGAPELMAVLTDFSSARPNLWPTIDADHFEVHDLGETWAEVTEGTASAWERARYEWDLQRRRVTVATHDSKVFGPGRRLGLPTHPGSSGNPDRRRTDPPPNDIHATTPCVLAAAGRPGRVEEIVGWPVAGQVTITMTDNDQLCRESQHVQLMSNLCRLRRATARRRRFSNEPEMTTRPSETNWSATG
jgi:hypothetical protein